METVLISGGTGLIGKSLTSLLVFKGYKVIVLTRSERSSTAQVSYAKWDVAKQQIDMQAIAEADHIIHLAGEGIADKRWSEKRKKEIVDSRVNSGKLLVSALESMPNKVQTFISASAIGWYGPDKLPVHPFVESDGASSDFLGQTCKLWEESVQAVEAMGKRLVTVRTGIVLGNDGGAFPEFLKPLKFGVAGILGSGNQVMSWIHIDDMCRVYAAAIENKSMRGVYNGTAPETVTNKQFTLALAKARGKPFIPVHVPVFALQIYLGEMKIEVLKSTTVDDEKLRRTGFTFLFPSLKAALGELV